MMPFHQPSSPVPPQISTREYFVDDEVAIRSSSLQVRSSQPQEDVVFYSASSLNDLAEDRSKDSTREVVDQSASKLQSASSLGARGNLPSTESVSDFIQPSHSFDVNALLGQLAELNERYTQALSANTALLSVLHDYERTFLGMLEERNERLNHQPSSFNNSSSDVLLPRTERERLIGDLHSAHIAFQNLRQRYEEQKRMLEETRTVESSQRTRILELQGDLAAADRRYENLRRQAESKLDEANREITGMREAFDDEARGLRVRLAKADLRIASLESTIEAKSRENAELMGICDELIGKMDSNKKVQ